MLHWFALFLNVLVCWEFLFLDNLTYHPLVFLFILVAALQWYIYFSMCSYLVTFHGNQNQHMRYFSSYAEWFRVVEIYFDWPNCWLWIHDGACIQRPLLLFHKYLLISQILLLINVEIKSLTYKPCFVGQTIFSCLLW